MKRCIPQFSRLIILLAFISTFAVLMVWIFCSKTCRTSVTTVAGSAAPHIVCSGDLLFEENFNHLDGYKWNKAEAFSEQSFEWYTADSENSFVKDGKLSIKPTLTQAKIGAYQLEHGVVHLSDCTDFNPANCMQKADENTIISPVQSARLDTKNIFSFKYGRIEVIAKIATGDWLRSAVSLMPTHSDESPRFGGIDLFECRGNVEYKDDNGRELGTEHVASTIHFESQWNHKTLGVDKTKFSNNNKVGYNTGFHKFELIWNESGFKFLTDDVETGFYSVTNDFWQIGEIDGEDSWEMDAEMTAFDQELYIMIKLAVGSTNGFFPDFKSESGKKAWNDSSPSAMKEFWSNRQLWLPSWHYHNEDCSFLVDSIRVWAI